MWNWWRTSGCQWTLLVRGAPILAGPQVSKLKKTSWLCEVMQKIKLELQKRGKLDLSKWVEEEMRR